MNARRSIPARPARVVALATLVLLSAASVALALGNPVNDDTPHRGSDPYANVAPPTLVEDPDATINRHPPHAYRLDDDVNPLKDPIASLPHFLASIVWELTRLATGLMIALFVWAYHLDLLGAGAGSGTLGVIAAAISRLYQHTIGEAWLAVGVVLAGLWGIHKALVQRRYTETAGQLALSVALCVLALFFVLRPAQTITAVYQPISELSRTFLTVPSAAGSGSSSDPTGQLAERLHRTLVHEPWVVLEFGGTWHCATSDGEPREPSSYTQSGEPVAPADARCINNDDKYSDRVLATSGDERHEELQAIGKGETPDDAPDDYRLGPADRPAYDIQQAEGGFPRLAMSLVVLASNLGAILLLGAIAAALIVTQLLVLFWLVFAPIMLVAAAYPGRGHRLFTGWLQKLASSLIGIAIYSLILAVVLTLASALWAATPALGWLLAFALQGIFYWSILFYRRRIFELLTNTITGRDEIPLQRMPILRTIATGSIAHRLATHRTKRTTQAPAPGRASTPPAPPPRTAHQPAAAMPAPSHSPSVRQKATPAPSAPRAAPPNRGASTATASARPVTPRNVAAGGTSAAPAAPPRAPSPPAKPTNTAPPAAAPDAPRKAGS